MATLVQGLVARMGFDNTAYKKGMGEVQSIAHRTGNTIGAIGRTMRNVFAGYGAFRLVKGAVSTASQFQRGMAEVSTIVDTSKVSMAGLTKEVLGLAKSVGVSPRGLTKAYYQAISSGIKAGEATEFVGTAAKAAIAGLSDTFTAVDVLTSVINAYGDSAQNAMKYSDIMFETIRLGKTTFPELAAVIGHVAPVAAQMKIPFEEVAAAIGAMTIKGVQSDLAVTGLRQILVSILNPTKEAAETAAALGLEFNATAVASKGLGRFMQEVMGRTRGSTELLTKLFGNVRALTGVLAGFTGTAFTTQLAAMNKATGATEDAFVKMNQTLVREWETLKANFEASVIDITTRILPALIKALQDAGEAMKGPMTEREPMGTAAYEKERKRYEAGLLSYAMPKIPGMEREKAVISGKEGILKRGALGAASWIPIYGKEMLQERQFIARERLMAAIPFDVVKRYRETAGAAEWKTMQTIAGAGRGTAGRALTAGWQYGVDIGRLPALGPKYPWAKSFGGPEWATGTMGKGITPPQEWAARAGQQTVDAVESVDTQIGKTFGTLSQVLYRITKRLTQIEDDLRTQNAR